jgi:GNAT superfamily N-acetyltransferase
VIRRAAPDDAAAIAAVLVRGWRHAYADIVAPEDMPTVSEREGRFIELLADGAEVYVFDQDGRVAGFVALDGCELRAIYVDPPAQGAGVGTALLTAAVDALRAAGHSEAFLWTFEANGLARAFYERHGWQLVPGRQQRSAPEVRYRRSLAPPPAPAPGTEPPEGGTPRV